MGHGNVHTSGIEHGNATYRSGVMELGVARLEPIFRAPSLTPYGAAMVNTS